MSDEAPPALDAARLIAEVRRGDETALAEAYRRTFAGEMGRLVLAHHLAECGVGNAFGAHPSAGELRYQSGRHDGALLLALKAGFDQAALAVAVLTDNLEGHEDDAAFNYTPPADEPLDF